MSSVATVFRIGAFLAVTALAVVVIQRIFLSPVAKVPGPWYTKVTALPMMYHDLKGTAPAYFLYLHQRYGNVVCVAPGVVDVWSPEDSQQVHGFKRPFLKTEFYSRISPGAPSVFSTRDVEQHRRHRKLLSGALAQSSLKTVVPQVHSKVALTMQRMREEVQKTGAVDIAWWWTAMATDVIGELTFGEGFRILETGERNEYTRDLASINENMVLRIMFPMLGLLPTWLIPIKAIRSSFEIVMRMRNYARVSMQRQQDILAADPKTRPTLFTRVLKGEEDEVMTHFEVLLNAQVYIIAGSDTTAMTLTFLVWALCLDENAAVRRKLMDELATLSSDEDLDDDDKLKNLRYLEWVIAEGLRLYSAVPGALPRHVPAGGATFDRGKVFLEEGTTVQTSAYALHRNPETFPDPDVFRPERWAHPTRSMKEGGYLPFGGGSRICIGLNLAHMELRMALASFFRAFPDTTVSKGDRGMAQGDMDPVMHFLINPKGHRCMMNAH